MKKDKIIKKPGDNESLLSVIDINAIGSKKDPCFGIGFDLSTPECKSCGDTELCVIKTSQKLGKTRAELQAKQEFLDDTPIDEEGVKKLMRSLKRKGLTKKEILDKTQIKYELTRAEVRNLYKQLK